MNIKGVEGSLDTSHAVELEFSSAYDRGGESVTIHCQVVDHITDVPVQGILEASQMPFLHGKQLADPGRGSRIDLLLISSFSSSVKSPFTDLPRSWGIECAWLYYSPIQACHKLESMTCTAPLLHLLWKIYFSPCEWCVLIEYLHFSSKSSYFQVGLLLFEAEYFLRLIVPPPFLQQSWRWALCNSSILTCSAS